MATNLVREPIYQQLNNELNVLGGKEYHVDSFSFALGSNRCRSEVEMSG